MMRATRRSLLLGASALGIARAGHAATTLRIGDQRGNMRAVLEAADALRGVPYDISWVEFPAAAPLIEALNAEAIELGVVGDAPFTFGFAAGVPMRVIAARRSTQQGLAIVVPGTFAGAHAGRSGGQTHRDGPRLRWSFPGACGAAPCRHAG